MDARNYWQMFLETGAPEFYLLYNAARRMEDINVLDSARTGTEGYGVQ